jgi:hypothetical protein
MPRQKLIVNVLVALVGTVLVFVPYQPRKTQDDVVGLGTLVEAHEIEKPVIEPLRALEPLPTPASTATCEDFRAELGRYDWDVAIMRAVAMGESTCRWITGDNNLTFQQNGRTYGYSIGFLQYRILPGREACEDVTLQEYVACNYRLWREGGYSHWTVYNEGTYLKYM